MTDHALVGIGKILEQMMAHAPGTRVPLEQWPARFRYKCLACEDLGVERCVHPEYPDRSYMRPCIHCEKGKQVLAAWCAASDVDARPGPWAGMDHDEIDHIRTHPCAHDPLPATVHEPVLEPIGSR